MIKKVLIPNRGEIAVRIIRAAHALGIPTVVTLSELEKDTLAAQLSDEVHFFEDGPFSDNYLNIDLIIKIAQQYGANGIHPGYGFLAENHLLVKACEQNNIIFIGPSGENLKQMGDKQMARAMARKADLPLTPSWEGSIDEIISQSDEMSFPILIKAAMGGGGKGMVICQNKAELMEHLPTVARQAERYFGDPRIYAERYLQSPRHIEVQVLADSQGKTLHLYERECSVQRRFQKVIEEAPAPRLSNAKQNELCADAIKLCQAINYKSAGTLEFLLDEDGQHYFLEMNTRIQVEHCVTEEITGIDLVQWQFKIANGEALVIRQEDITINGHAVEARIYAENPDNDFQPSPGKIDHIIWPSKNGIRLERAFDKPSVIHSQFDPMIAKFIVHKPNREAAIEEIKTKLNDTVIYGITSNLRYLSRTLGHEQFKNGTVNTNFCQQHHSSLISRNKRLSDMAILAYALLRFNPDKGIDSFWRLHSTLNFAYEESDYFAAYQSLDDTIHLNINNANHIIRHLNIDERRIQFEYEGQKIVAYYFSHHEKYEIIIKNQYHLILADDILPAYQPLESKEAESLGNLLNAPLPGQVLKVMVKQGQEVTKGDVLIVLEAMKMENHLKAWKDGIIDQVHISNGDKVKSNQVLITTK